MGDQVAVLDKLPEATGALLKKESAPAGRSTVVLGVDRRLLSRTGNGNRPTRDDLLFLQRTLGNRAVQTLTRLRQLQRDPDPDPATVAGPSTLDQMYRTALAAARQTGDWQDAAEKLNGFSYPDIQTRLAELTADEVGYLHAGAKDNPRVGPDSNVGKLTEASRPPASTGEPPLSQEPTPSKTPDTPPATQGKCPKPVPEMTSFEKLSCAIDFARESRDEKMQEQLKGLQSNQSILAMVTFAALFIGAQVTPVGWIADALALTGVTLAALFAGAVVFQVASDLGTFVGAINAPSESELKVAGDALAEAVAIGGVLLVTALVTHAAGEIPPGRSPFTPPPMEGFEDAVTADGQLVRFPKDAQKPSADLNKAADVPETNSGPATGGPSKGSTGRILSETRVGGKAVIRSEVGIPPGTRLGLERLLPRGVEVGREGWQRAHSQGPITGAESGEGILLAPEEVNQGMQRTGIEQFVSDLNTQKADDTTLFMTTETEAQPGTLALKSITYRIEASRAGGRPTILYEAEITVGDQVDNPTITVSADQVTDETPFLKTPPTASN